MTNTLKVEHFTAEDYDDYVLISSSLNDNKPFKFLTKGFYWAARFYPPLFDKYRYLYFSKDELKDDDIDDIIGESFRVACLRNGLIKRHNWLISTDEDEDENECFIAIIRVKSLMRCYFCLYLLSSEVIPVDAFHLCSSLIAFVKGFVIFYATE